MTISRLTGIDVVADFRTAAFTDSAETRVILNIGGIANITILPAAASEQAPSVALTRAPATR